MKVFAQLDNNVVTGTLFAEDAPTVLPPGRRFVELSEAEADQLEGGETFDPLVEKSRNDFPQSHRSMHGFSKPVRVPSVSANDKLDRILVLLERG